MNYKVMTILLILLCCFIGAASAVDDVSADVVDVADDSVAVDAVSDDVSDSLESVDDEAVVDESAPAQDEIDDVELEASVDDEPALDEVDDELSGQSPMLNDDGSPTELYINISREGTTDDDDEPIVSGADWENAYGGIWAYYNALYAIADDGVIYVASGTYSNFLGTNQKNYTIIGQNNTIFSQSLWTEQSYDGVIHTYVNVLFHVQIQLRFRRIDLNRDFIRPERLFRKVFQINLEREFLSHLHRVSAWLQIIVFRKSNRRDDRYDEDQYCCYDQFSIHIVKPPLV